MMHGFSTLGRKKAASQNKWRAGNEHKFLGEGQTFRGKLIGVLEVPEARGDKMCQDAIQELKMAIKASGEHKQRVIIHIAVDGLKIREEKTGDCLYHHPVHKISFIAQDITDGRAFGYIYGSPDNGHRFFGIKTEKAAGQVVVSMRDLFQVVFELKKKEIDEAKMQLGKEREMMQTSLPTANHPDVLPSSAVSFPSTEQQQMSAAAASGRQELQAGSGGGINDLLGLESELSKLRMLRTTTYTFKGSSNIQAGIQQIDKLAPESAPMSFHPDSMMPAGYPGYPGQQLYNHQQAAMAAAGTAATTTTAGRSFPQAIVNTGPLQQKKDIFGATPFLPPPPSKAAAKQQGDTDAFGASAFTAKSAGTFFQAPTSASSVPDASVSGPASQAPNKRQQLQPGSPTSSPDLFANLDPLGTGKSKPYVDKKDFFSETKASTSSGPAKTTLAELMAATKGHNNQPVAASSNVDSSLSSVGSHLVSGGIVSSRVSGSAYEASQQELQIQQQLQMQQMYYLSMTDPRLVAGYCDSSCSPRLASSSSVDYSTTARSSGRSGRFSVTGDGPSWYAGERRDSRNRSSSASRCSSSGYFTTGRPGLRYAAIPTVPVTGVTVMPMQSSVAVRVSLPQGPSATADETAANPQTADGGTASSYGSIPHLEASPRRYRQQYGECPQYEAGATSLGMPAYSHPSGPQSAQNPDQPPPKLPDKPSKQSSASPPPLPPKKPPRHSDSQGSAPENTSGETSAEVRDDIYDFPPDPVIGSSGANMTKEESKKCISDILHQHKDVGKEVKKTPPTASTELPLISLVELSRMSVMELNEKMEKGQLPPELKGMSIFELVEFVAKQLKKRSAQRQQEKKAASKSQDEVPNNATRDGTEGPSVPSSSSQEIKPSFSDNFVSSHLSVTSAQPDASSSTAQKTRSTLGPRSADRESIGSMSPGPPSSLRPDLSLEIFEFEAPETVAQPEPITNESLIRRLTSGRSNSGGGESRSGASTGFGDDFSKMNKQDQLADLVGDGRASGSTTGSLPENKDSADRYAVLRELQMEDDLIRAWKSPSDEEKEMAANTKKCNGEEEKTSSADHREYYEPRVCSSEGSPCSRSESEMEKSDGSEDEEREDSDDSKNVDEDEDERGQEDDVGDRNAQGDSEISLCHQDASDLSRTGSHKSTKSGYGQTEKEDPGEQELPKAGTKEAADSFENAFGPTREPTVSKSWATFDEVPLPRGSRMPDNDLGKSHQYRLLRRRHDLFARRQDDGCDSDQEIKQYYRESTRQFACRQGTMSSQDLPYNDLEHRGLSRYVNKSVDHSSSKEDSLEGNPFGQDAFTPPIQPRSSSHQESKNGNVEDVFQSESILGERGFKVHVGSNGSVPKSDSVNIFTIRDDPFDDDFFTQ